jgi:nifR3 family TIM-barrel protein
MKNFWMKLKKPFFCLAPMAGVTDCAFRKIIAKCGKPDVLWTEMVSADGLVNPKGRKKLLINLKFSKNEHPIVAQIFGSNPESIEKASALCAKLGFDGIDINMGCPDKSIEKQNSGAAMIKNPELAKKIIRAAKDGAPNLPISVKTRIGYDKMDLSWLKFLLGQRLPVLTVHLRTKKEMSKVPAHWELTSKIVALRNKISPETLIIGNGDVKNVKSAKEKAKKYGCDGVMIGRATLGNPWLFKKLFPAKNFSKTAPPETKKHGTHTFLKNSLPEIRKKLVVLIEHSKLFEKFLGKYKSFAVIKKHFKAYINGFKGAKELRMKLMETKSASQVEKIINNFLTRM